MATDEEISNNLESIITTYKSENEFVQAVTEVYDSLKYLFKVDKKYLD